MTIIRTIASKSYPITLTREEAWGCYLEVQRKLDLEDIKDLFSGLTDDDTIPWIGAAVKECVPLFDEMASELRRNIDKYDMTWDSAREYAVRDVVTRRILCAPGK